VKKTNVFWSLIGAEECFPLKISHSGEKYKLAVRKESSASVAHFPKMIIFYLGGTKA